ncbi:hypothetical protein RHMOL_Rhmol10G0200400 [Rhododendron molle]|uniref:Uncharacterized protein n=1 Tax=Rhododendron molle TaxID=49168 RepID=A0ACC0M5C9_RHOML|nr:hypothetical protein RHMOL_Rhmol10G0200400 [Rhododendron molle]
MSMWAEFRGLKVYRSDEFRMYVVSIFGGRGSLYIGKGVTHSVQSNHGIAIAIVLQFKLFDVIPERGPNASEKRRDWIKRPTEGSRVWKKVDLAAKQRMSRPGNGCGGQAIDLAAEALISQGDFASNRLLR